MPCGGGAGAGGGSRSRENQDQREDAAAPSAKRGRQRKPPTGNPVLGGGACPDRGADAARGAGETRAHAHLRGRRRGCGADVRAFSCRFRPVPNTVRSKAGNTFLGSQHSGVGRSTTGARGEVPPACVGQRDTPGRGLQPAPAPALKRLPEPHRGEVRLRTQQRGQTF